MFPKITSVFLNLTNACNLACRYCFVQQDPKKMTLQTAIDAADWVAANTAESPQVPTINFFGGEPLLMWDEVVRPLTEYIRGRYGFAYHLSMTSNCTLMTEEIASFMKRNGVGLLLSMDGDRESQDWNRPMKNGGSGFELLDRKLPMLLEHFPRLTFRSTVTPHTAPYLFHNSQYAESKGFHEWFIMPNYFEAWSEEDIAALRENMTLYAAHYIEKLRRGEHPIYFTQMEKSFSKIVRRNQCIQRNERRGEKLCGSCAKCGLGASRFAGINLDGSITACQEFFSRSDDFFTIGSIYTGVDEEKRRRLCRLWDSAEARGDQCESCELDRICDGGCVANNFMISGDLHRAPGIACEWSRILFDSAVTVMQTLGGERNRLFRERWKRYVG